MLVSIIFQAENEIFGSFRLSLISGGFLVASQGLGQILQQLGTEVVALKSLMTWTFWVCDDNYS